MLPDIPSPHPDRRRGSVLLLVLIFTSLLATITASYGGTVDAALDVQRDESRILHAEFAAESGVEFARRQLLLDPDWVGTGIDGGVAVYCPKDYDLRQGYRNMIQLKDQTCIGGGDQGVEPNIGLIAPGGKVKNDCKGTWMCGFHFLNEIGNLKNSTILGQLVVLNRVQMLKDSDVIYYNPAALDGPSMINFGSTAGKVDITSLFENFN